MIAHAVDLVLEAGPATLYTWDAEETEIAAAPTLVQAKVPFLTIAFDALASDLINPSAETGTLQGWVQTQPEWTAVTTAPRFGTYHFRGVPTVAQSRLTNKSRLQVSTGDRVLAQGFVRLAGAGTGDALVRIRWYDSSGTPIGLANGNTVTGTAYEISRAIAVAPANAVTASFEFQLDDGAGSEVYCDGAYMDIIPKNFDIDISETSGEAGTDNIAEEAATEVYSLKDASETVTNVAVTVASIAVPEVPVAHTAQVMATFDAWREEVGNFTVFLQRDGDAVAHNVRSILPDSSPGERITLMAEFSRPAASADTYELNYLGVDPGDVTEFRNISMRVEIIKR